MEPASVQGQKYWKLPSGSHIAYVRMTAEKTYKKTPIIFLHGGPGILDMAGDSRYFGYLTLDGHDVYVYDQVGTGRSSRLDDPLQYTTVRHTADLEAIREKIGSDRIVLMGFIGFFWSTLLKTAAKEWVLWARQDYTARHVLLKIVRA